ncbi:unnamed protein product [Urochloa humidicola]
MEKTVSELADLVKKMQDDRLADRAADREAVKLLQESLDANTLVMKDVVKWRPSVDSKVDELWDSVKNLQHKVEKMAIRQEELSNPAYKVFESEDIDLTKQKPAPAYLGVNSLEAASGSDDHRSAKDHRGSGQGVVTTLVPSPVTGQKNLSHLTPVPFSLQGIEHDDVHASNSNWKTVLPQLDFPTFDGSFPKIWMKKCENFFEIYAVPSPVWVKYATMSFSGSAAFWLQSMGPSVINSSWQDLCKAVCGRFEKEKTQSTN